MRRTLDELLSQTLPLNRKERYYTGTVLPGLICADDMRHLPRLGRLLRLEDPLVVRSDPEDCTVVFFTEYGIAESVLGVRNQEERRRFAQLPTERDTPDVVILVTEPAPVLIGIEAKFYDRPSPAEMRSQLARQRQQLDPLATLLATSLDVPEVIVCHAALLPDQLVQPLNLDVPVITWQRLLTAYADVAPAYWIAMLSAALDRYSELVSSWAGYQDSELSGENLVERWRAGDETYPWMGRQGGLLGEKVAGEITSGRWRTIKYQCRKQPAPTDNRNWFAVADFLALLESYGQLSP